MKRVFFLLTLLAFTAISLQPAKAGDFGSKAEAFIQDLADNAINAMRSAESDEKRLAELRKLLNEGFDIRAIGKWVLGRYWRVASDTEKEEYLELFEEFILVTYGNRFNDYAGDDVTFKVVESLVQDDRDAVVRSEVLRPNASEPILVDWRIKADQNNEMKIVDVKVAGVSMSQTQRSEFASVIKNNGGKVSGLIKALRSKTDELVSNVETAGS